MLVVTIVFLPQPVIVGVVMLQVTMILVGLFGFMSLWDLSLSAITMIHLVMSVGFSVDFCAHICTAYMVSDETTRHGRALDAIVHASGPILNGGFSSMLGVLILSITESYIFKSFFKVMLLVIGFGAAHAILLVPVILSFIGPKSHMRLEEPGPNNAELSPPSVYLPDEATVANGSTPSDKIAMPGSNRKIKPVDLQEEKNIKII
ncbi:patched domain-containing protein 3 [Elysia marginata]|uniref:Patched domain-containing protein 3 n=1 Tax=Elysia marginata TaxID=1093978 RepID=A0AAV4EPP6_9GAST|nr:patched domain-containing protein 3 [Elysia marginata]